MALIIQPTCSSYTSSSSTSSSLTLSFVSSLGRLHNGRIMGKGKKDIFRLQISGIRRSQHVVTRASSGGGLGSRWEEWWKPREKLKLLPDSIPCLSDILWPSAGVTLSLCCKQWFYILYVQWWVKEWWVWWWAYKGAFAAMALLGRLDQMVAPWGLSFTIAPLGAVCAVLFATPNSPAAQVLPPHFPYPHYHLCLIRNPLI